MSTPGDSMLLRLTAEDLRKIADQVDAYTALGKAGATRPKPNTVIAVDGDNLAYLHWSDSGGQFMAEFINFTPGAAEPLRYHRKGPRDEPVHPAG